MSHAASAPLTHPRDVARRFVCARLTAVPLPDFPGTVPSTLQVAYACQDAAIAQWPDEVQGWKSAGSWSPG